jgi:two-component system response regulator YcbB
VATFIIVDDDPAVRRIIAGLIREEKLGEVVAEARDGGEAVTLIQHLRPDIAVLDLLLPQVDGIAVAEAARACGCPSAIVVLSQVMDKEMVARAYRAGVQFFVHKPINRTEILSVLATVLEHLSLKKTVEQVRQLVHPPSPAASETSAPHVPAVTHRVLAHLGVAADAGATDIVELVEFLEALGPRQARHRLQHLQELYREVTRARGQPSTPAPPVYSASAIRAMEQRIRRTIARAMANVARLGLEQPAHPVFQRYGSRFFPPAELKKQMRYLEGRSKRQGRVHTRVFLEALLEEVEHQLSVR